MNSRGLGYCRAKGERLGGLGQVEDNATLINTRTWICTAMASRLSPRSSPEINGRGERRRSRRNMKKKKKLWKGISWGDKELVRVQWCLWGSFPKSSLHSCTSITHTRTHASKIAQSPGMPTEVCAAPCCKCDFGRQKRYSEQTRQWTTPLHTP